MKVLLVKPFDISDEVIPPISLGWLAAHIKDRHQVRILDALKERKKGNEIPGIVQRENIDVVGFQVWTKDIHNVKSTSIAIKSVNPKTKIIVGGCHPTVLPERTINFLGESIDFAFQGEGEVGFRLLVDALCSGDGEGSFKEIPGLVWRDGHDIHVNKNTFIQDLDALGFPAWELMPPSTYPKAPHGAFYKNFPVAPIIVTRGCPYPCTFCSARVISGSKIRTRSVGHVIEELSMLYRKFHVREFHIEDDNFTLSRDFVENFCESLLRKEIRMTWGFPNGIRLDTMDRPLFRLMKRAGCYALNFGIESGSPRILKMIKKKLDLEQIREQLTLAKEERFEVGGFFILGFPTETREEMEETISFARSLPLDRIGVSYFQPFPGSTLYHELVNAGEIDEDWVNHHHTTLHDLTYVSSTTTVEELRRARRKLLVSFYFRLGILWGLLRQVRSHKHLYYITKRGIRWLRV
ncbi:MAG: radical SAM protein [Deltaproteobacteria bacterium]|nr:radical SAM protein [Deltaproteobacteria bacterium]MBW2022351.1 radical SAM protein [Deltaproteobacteria bacterium]MBW2082673.1 radical SAM protein [Deltaproteobacteria bacterium]